MANRKRANLGYDYMILIPVTLLMGLGLVIVYSASSQLALDRMGDGYFYLKRQALFCLLGLVIMITAKSIPHTLYCKLAYPLLLISSVLLIALLVPGLGRAVCSGRLPVQHTRAGLGGRRRQGVLRELRDGGRLRAARRSRPGRHRAVVVVRTIRELP